MSSIYPTIVPENAPQDTTTGAFVPTGWELTPSYDTICITCEQECKRAWKYKMRAAVLDANLDPVSPAYYHDYITAQTQLGTQNCSLLAQHWYAWDRLRNVINWMDSGMPYSKPGNLVAGLEVHGGLAVHRKFRSRSGGAGSDTNGYYVAVYHDYDPDDNTYFRPFQEGSPGFMVEPSSMLRVGTVFGVNKGNEFYVVKVDYSNSAYVKIYVHKNIGSLIEQADIFFYNESDEKPTFRYFNPSVSLFVQRLTTEWFTETERYLTKADGTNGRIAYPYKPTSSSAGTFQVLVKGYTIAVKSSMNVGAIAHQSGTTVRYTTYNLGEDLSEIEVDHLLVVQNTAYPTNSGSFVITAIDDDNDWIEVTNSSSLDDTYDEPVFTRASCSVHRYGDTPTDITSAILEKFGPRGEYNSAHWLKIYYDTTLSEFVSYIDLSAYDGIYTEFQVMYCVEALSQTDTTVSYTTIEGGEGDEESFWTGGWTEPVDDMAVWTGGSWESVPVAAAIGVLDAVEADDEGLTVWKATEMMCLYCQRDFSNSICTLKSNALYSSSRTAVGSGIDSSGNHWFCARSGELAVDLPIEYLQRFQAGACYNTDCPNFALNVPWWPSVTDFNDMLFGKDMYYEQKSVISSGSGNWELCRSSQPGLFFLAGMNCQTNEGLQQKRINWLNGSQQDGSGGTCGRLVADPDTGLSDVVYGAVKEGEQGVLALATYSSRLDRIGGRGTVLPYLFDDGSDYYDLHNYVPIRNYPIATLGEPHVDPSGYGESHIQKVRRMKMSFPDIRANKKVNVGQWYAEWTAADGVYLKVYAVGGDEGYQGSLGRPFRKNITYTRVYNMEFVQNSTGTYLWIDFEPGVVITGVTNFVEDDVRYWVTGGCTVKPPPWKLITNYYAADAYGDVDSFLMRGDTVHFRSDSLEKSIKEIGLTCIYAHAFGGLIYGGAGITVADGLVSVLAGPVGVGVPQWYDISFNRLSMDRAMFCVEGYKVQEVKDWFDANPLPTDLSVAVSTSSAMPPKQYVIVDGAAVNNYLTDYMVTIKHYEDQTLVGTLVEDTDFEYDAANGSFHVFSAVTDTWDTTKTQCLSVEKASGGNPYIVSRENTRNANLITDVTAAHRALEWMELGNLPGVQKTIGLHHRFDKDFDLNTLGNYSAWDSNFLEQYEANPGVAYSAHTAWDIGVPTIFGANPGLKTIIASNPELIGGGMDLVIVSGLPTDSEGRIKTGVDIGFEDDSVTATPYPTVQNIHATWYARSLTDSGAHGNWNNNDAYFFDGALLRRMNPEWVAEARIQIRVGNVAALWSVGNWTNPDKFGYGFAKSPTYYTAGTGLDETTFPMTLGAAWIQEAEGSYFVTLPGQYAPNYAPAAWVRGDVAGNVVFSSAVTAEADTWADVDITALVQSVLDGRILSGQELYIFIAGVGENGAGEPMQVGAGTNETLGQFFYGSGEIGSVQWAAGAAPNSKGMTTHPEGHTYSGGYIDYGSVNFRNFRVKLNFAAMEASNSLPHIAYRGNHAANWPANAGT